MGIICLYLLPVHINATFIGQTIPSKLGKMVIFFKMVGKMPIILRIIVSTKIIFEYMQPMAEQFPLLCIYDCNTWMVDNSCLRRNLKQLYFIHVLKSNNFSDIEKTISVPIIGIVTTP